MEREILELLKGIDNRLSNLEEGQKRLEKKVDSIVEETANLIEFRTSVIAKFEELKEVEEVTRVNCFDIARLKAVK
ncbi:plasmid stabilization protein [Clostridium sp. DSM 100503]|uniref:plasmid stabilization protein n=1 Tax=Clostridium sp. DSM 100503 TaxID=2963282 RepID=UPI00214A4EEB|nr:plasmid stabilization protein [Clostridium sp. DSM 100503]MCR1951269.1 plasmid stabilization protein [Clostridium sp. DSM 100503]